MGALRSVPAGRRVAGAGWAVAPAPGPVPIAAPARGGFALSLAILCTLGALAPAAWAEETTFQVGNAFESSYDSQYRESVVDDRLDVRVAHGIYAVGATLLSHSPSDASRLDPNDYGTEAQGIRKRWIEADAGSFFVRAGDSYATFGRGLVLNIFEDQTVDFDNVIDGVNARATGHGLEAEILSGTNSLGAPEMVLKAGRIAAALPANWKVGIQGAWSDYNLGTAGARSGGDRLYGGLLQGALGPRLDLYGEYAMRDARNATGGPSRDPSGRRLPQGHAGYASAGVNLGAVQLLGEYKDLLHYKLPQVNTRDWVSPPPVVPQHMTTLLNKGGHTPNIDLDDERGGLAEAYVNLPHRSRLVTSYGRTRARHSGQSSWETSGEFETWFGDETEVVVRANETEETVLEGGQLVFFERITWGGTVVVPVREGWSLDLTGESQAVRQVNRPQRHHDTPTVFRENVVGATVSSPNGMSWGLTAQWTDEENLDRDRWLWAVWNLRIGDRHQLSLGGGTVRAGQICSGGVCKIVDKFEGGRVELITTF